MGSNERREREKQELRAKILDAARALFVEEGYEAVTMRKIAEKIEYSPTALYFHFADKTALIRALCEHDFLAFASQFVKLMKIADPVERVRRSGEAYVEFAITHPHQYRLMFMTPHPKEATPQLAESNNPEENAYQFLRMNVEEAMNAGRLRPELKDVELVAQVLWAGVHGVASLYIAKGDAEWVEMRDPKKMAKIMVDGLMRGLLREAPLTKNR